MKKKASRSYTVFFEAAPEGGYVARVPMLPGCPTQGESLERLNAISPKRSNCISKR